jgi:CheY-like chemotaxis protein
MDAAFDVVSMDCRMPGLDDSDATGEIRKHEGGKCHAAISAVTANALTGGGEKCIASGMDDYLSRPFMAESLHAVLSLYLQSDGSVAE